MIRLILLFLFLTSTCFGQTGTKISQLSLDSSPNSGNYLVENKNVNGVPTTFIVTILGAVNAGLSGLVPNYYLPSTTDQTNWNSKQTAYNNLTSIGVLMNSSGCLSNNGGGTFSYVACSGGSGGMTWPASAGIAVYSGSSSWSASILGTSSQFVKGNGSLDSNTYITGNQSITLSGDLSGSGTTTINGTLNTVNSNIGTFQGLTVNGKGLVTAATNEGYISGNQSITLGGILSGSGTTSITASAGSGYYMPSTTDESNWNAKQINLSLAPGTYVNGDVCTYTSSGTILNCNTAAGSGTVTSIATTSPITGGTITSTGTIGIAQANTSTSGYLLSTDWNTFNNKVSSVGLSSPNKTLQVGSTPVTSNGTITADVNWTDINGISQINRGGINWQDINLAGEINMGGINWYSAQNLNQGINWYDVPLITQSIQTVGSGNDLLVQNGTGNVGINSTSPGQVLDVFGTARMTGFILPTNPTSGYVLTTNSVGIGTWAPASGGGGSTSPGGSNEQIQFNNNGSFGGNAKFFFDGANVGIGTSSNYDYYETSPQIILLNAGEFQINAISTSSADGGGISIGQDTGSAVSSGARVGKIEFTGPINGTGINNGYSAAGIASYAESNWSGSNTNADLIFQTTPSSSTTRTTALWVDGSGNVGIGTLQPTQGFQIGTDAASSSGYVSCIGTGNCIGACQGTINTTTGACGTCNCLAK